MEQKVRYPFGAGSNDAQAADATNGNTIVFDHAGQSVTVSGTGSVDITLVGEGLLNGDTVTLVCTAGGSTLTVTIDENEPIAITTGNSEIRPYVYSSNGKVGELVSIKPYPAP